MKTPIRIKTPLLKIINNILIDLPTPSNISLWWNFGSLLGICLIIQIITGIFLSIHYTPNTIIAFNRISHICRNVNYGWLLRTLHANGASLFFICLYIHIGRGIYYNSFKHISTWIIGIIILFIIIATAFLGYVLPWGQISFWGATVITNLLSTIPYIGNNLVQWLWGGFAIDNATLNRFFSFHFILPFIISAFVIIHLFFLHQTGSNNPLGIRINIDKIPFYPYFIFKDLLRLLILLIILLILTLTNPYILCDPDNFSPANPLVTPTHIQPEWYFLFAYAILRSIPNKLGGVLALVSSIIILFLLPWINNKKIQPISFYPIEKFIFFVFITIFYLLTWIGSCPVEPPFILTRQIFTAIYFSYFITAPISSLLWDFIIFK